MHYLQGKIQIELLLPLSILHNMRPDSKNELEQRFRQAVKNVEEIEQISLYFH